MIINADGPKGFVERRKDYLSMYRSFFEQAMDAIFITTLDGEVLEANHQAEIITGNTKNELYMNGVIDIHKERFMNKMAALFKSMVKNIHLEDVPLLKKDGSILQVDIKSSVIDFKGGKALLWIMRDISSRKLIEREQKDLSSYIEEKVEERTRSIVERLKKAEEDRLTEIEEAKRESLGDLVAGISHEFNNALTTVIGFTELLIKESHDEKTKSALLHILKQAEWMKGLVRRLNSFSRPEEPRKELTDINGLIEEFLDMYSTKCAMNSIQIEKDLCVQTVEIMIDKEQIKQVLLNIFNNAVDAILEKGARDRKITISTHEDVTKNLVYIKISDNGIGIPKDLINRIFDPFFTAKEVGKGVGLGLSISQSIVKKHGGYITVTSEVGKGTDVFIVLPIVEEKPAGKLEV